MKVEWSSGGVEWSSEEVEWSSREVEWYSGVAEWSSREVEWSSGVVEKSSGVQILVENYPTFCIKKPLVLQSLVLLRFAHLHSSSLSSAPLEIKC